MLKFFYEKFWYPFFGQILSKFIFIIEGNDHKRLEQNKFKKTKQKR